MKDRLERRANRVPPGDPREVLAAAQARAASPGSADRPGIQPRFLVAAAAVVGVVALAVGGWSVLSDDGAESVTVAGPDDTAQESLDGNWAIKSLVRDGERRVARVDALVTIEGGALKATDGCGNQVNAAVDGAVVRTSGGSLKFVPCEDSGHDEEAQELWQVINAEPTVEIRGDELWIVVAEGDALIFKRTGGFDDLAAGSPPRSGAECPGLRSETVWAGTGDSEVITAPAGGTATYEETTTNAGSETCSIVWADCPAPGALFTTAGEPLPADSIGCPAIAYPPEDLPPGESRTETWTIPLTNPPGTYELRVPQRDGTTVDLPITVEEALDACAPGTSELVSVPEFDQYVDRGDTTFAQLQFAETTERCTIRIAEVVMTLGSGGRLVAHQFTSDTPRRFMTGPNGGALGEVTLGPIDLPEGQYEGTLEVRLENGESFTKPARLLVGDSNAAGVASRPVPVMWFELVQDDVLRLTLGYCGDAYGVHAEETAEAVTVRAETFDDPQTVAPDCATFAEIGLTEPLGERTVMDGTTGETVSER